MIKKFIAKNCTHILTGFGVAGIFGTAILTGYGAIKAKEIIDEHCQEIHADDEQPYIVYNDIPFKEKVKLTWKCFIPAAAVGAVTIASFMGGHVIDTKRLQDMTNAYILSKDAFARYREEVTNWVGEEHEAQIDDRSKEKCKDEPSFTPKKTITFFDPITRQTFKATPQDIIFAEGNINKMFQNNQCCSYWYFLKCLGVKVPAITRKEKLGWWLDDTFSWDSSYFGNWISVNYCKVPGKDYYELIFDHGPYEPDEPDEWSDYEKWERL